jgi:predicted nucleic acid-binding protein
VTGKLLLDTGALISLLDRGQPRHAQFVEYFQNWFGEVVCTEAVLTEATHLLERIPRGADTCLDFFLSGGAMLVPSTTDSLWRARELMRRYEDLPMDFADATLVVLAEDIGTDLVFTTDRRDFSVYRIRGRKAFRIVP